MLFDSHAHAAFGAESIRFRPEYTIETLRNGPFPHRQICCYD